MRLNDGLSAIKDKRLKISRLDRLNDPFEFLSIDLRDREKRRGLMRAKAEIAKNNGLLCFSKNWHNPVLWSHYADKHRGLSLGFDVPVEKIRHVAYVDSRLPWPDKLSEEFTKQLLFTKFAHWSYEDEYRAWASLEEKVVDEYYANFSEQLVLKQLLVGAESKITRAEIDDILGDIKGAVEVFKVRAAFSSFRIVRNKDELLWA